jgi:type I restriction enzyme S subunit
MSTNIKQLIDELCPDGVEWKTLGEVCKVLRGERLTKKELSSEFQYPVFHGGLIPLGYYYKYNREANKTMIINTGSIGEVVWCSVPFWSSDGTFTIETQNNIIDKFLYYYLKIKESYLKSQKREGGVPTIDRNVIENLPIPLPPMPVQEEIVRILDKFTELIQLLERELELRHKQYEYYRNKLLTPTEENGSWLLNGHPVEWKTLGEVCDVTSGGTPSKSKKEYWENGIIPWLKSEVCNNTSIYSASDFITELGLKNSSTKLLEKNITLMAMVGATRFKTAFLEFEACTNQNIASINSKIKNKLSNKFIFYYLTNKYDEFRKKMSSYGMINLETIRSINIPIPPMEEQERIVAILDKFDALVNDISQGLPAEIQARTKQYEYYRNKLLTFKEKDS